MLVALLWAATALSDQTSLQRFDFAEVHMGGRASISLYAPNQAKAEAAARAAFERIASLEDVASDYRAGSEVRKMAAGLPQGKVRVSADLWRLLSRSQEVARASGGAFDITAGPYVALWREARRTGRMAAWPRFKEARGRVGWTNLTLDARGRSVSSKLAGLQIDLGGIAKGDAVDQALMALEKNGVKRALVHMGGDMAASGPPVGQKGWRIQAEAVPGGELWLAHQALSTSGDSEQHVDIGGVRYSHIVDPRTGFGVTTRVQATVLARRGLLTDPLATALCVLGPEKGRALARKMGVRAWFVVPAE